jgi:hypothetical protein
MSDEILKVAYGAPQDPTGTGAVRRRLGGRGGFWSGVFAGLVGIILLVAGILGFARATDRHAATSRADTQRGVLRATERKARNTGSTINGASGTLVDNVGKLTISSSALRTAQNAITDAFNHAVDLGNGGDLNRAQGSFAGQSPALAELDLKLAAAQQDLLHAQQSLDQLTTTQRG